jgi:hypothetical protein
VGGIERWCRNLLLQLGKNYFSYSSFDSAYKCVDITSIANAAIGGAFGISA